MSVESRSTISLDENLIKTVRFPAEFSRRDYQFSSAQQQVLDFLKCETYQRMLSAKLRNNSEMTTLEPEIFGKYQPRPLSAFYFLMPSGEVVLETGLVRENNEGVLHTEMVISAQHMELVRELPNQLQIGPVVSGHFWKTAVPIALLDNSVRMDRKLMFADPYTRMMVENLTINGYICVGSEGETLSFELSRGKPVIYQ